MGTRVVETDESKGAAADMRTGGGSTRAVQGGGGVAREDGGEDTGPEQ